MRAHGGAGVHQRGERARRVRGLFHQLEGVVELSRHRVRAKAQRVAGDTLRFRAYTVTGQLYDAFELVKEAPNAPSTFTALMDAGAAMRTHDNTIPYERP